jgi:hypothetical protein
MKLIRGLSAKHFSLIGVVVVVSLYAILSQVNPDNNESNQCSSVEAKILKMEKDIRSQISFWNLRVDKDLSPSEMQRKEKFDEKNLTYEVWKSSFNMPSCFTNAQNLEISRRTNFLGRYSRFGVIDFYQRTNGSGDECIGLSEEYFVTKNEGNLICNIPPRWRVRFSEDYVSIYSF